MRSILEITLLFVVATVLPHIGNASEIETKYLMFKIPKVRFDDILQLKKPGGKLDFGDGTVLTHDDIEPTATDQSKNFAYKGTLRNPLQLSGVTIHPNCVLDFIEFKERKVNKYLLVSVDCEKGMIEIDRVKLRGIFHPTFAKDEFHFASEMIISVTEVPLTNGTKVPSKQVISINEFDSEKRVNRVKNYVPDN